jgi:hypothetical protein
MSTSSRNDQVIADRLTSDRLRSYLARTPTLSAAIDLYDWNVSIAGALHEDLGRVEVVLRNAMDVALTQQAARHGWGVAWFDRSALFPGRQGQRTLDDITGAKRRAAARNPNPPAGSVITELTFGFWRFLCTPAHLTSLWVPALAAAFPHHPNRTSPRVVRADVEDRVQRLHFLRNRIAHHEPIHGRNLSRDVRSVDDLVGWICPDSAAWLRGQSRTQPLLTARPQP